MKDKDSELLPFELFPFFASIGYNFAVRLEPGFSSFDLEALLPLLKSPTAYLEAIVKYLQRSVVEPLPRQSRTLDSPAFEGSHSFLLGPSDELRCFTHVHQAV